MGGGGVVYLPCVDLFLGNKSARIPEARCGARRGGWQWVRGGGGSEVEEPEKMLILKEKCSEKVNQKRRTGERGEEKLK